MGQEDAAGAQEVSNYSGEFWTMPPPDSAAFNFTPAFMDQGSLIPSWALTPFDVQNVVNIRTAGGSSARPGGAGPNTAQWGGSSGAVMMAAPVVPPSEFDALMGRATGAAAEAAAAIKNPIIGASLQRLIKLVPEAIRLGFNFSVGGVAAQAALLLVTQGADAAWQWISDTIDAIRAAQRAEREAAQLRKRQTLPGRPSPGSIAGPSPFPKPDVSGAVNPSVAYPRPAPAVPTAGAGGPTAASLPPPAPTTVPAGATPPISGVGVTPPPSLWDQALGALADYGKAQLNRAKQQIGTVTNITLPGFAPSSAPQQSFSPFAFMGGNASPSPAPIPKGKQQPGAATSSSSSSSCECQGNRFPKRTKGECGQGYFKELPNGNTEFTYWSHRKCP